MCRPLHDNFIATIAIHGLKYVLQNMLDSEIQKYQAVAEIAAEFAQIGRKDERIKNPPVGGAATHRGRTT